MENDRSTEARQVDPARAPSAFARTLNLASLPLAGLPLALVLVFSLMGQPEYEFFPLLAGVIAILAWSRSQDLGSLRSGRLPHAAWIGLALALLFAITGLAIQRMSLLWALAAAIAVAWRMGGWPMVRAWAPPVACILWAVPPPLGLHGWLTRQFQALAVDACHHALMAVDLLHAVRGLLIALPEHTFFVSEACSGVRSLGAMGAFASVWAVGMRRPAWHVALLILASLGWVLVVNIGRILAIVVGFKFRLDLSEGWTHSLLGLSVFLAGMMLIFGTDIAMAWVAEWLRGPRSFKIRENEATRWDQHEAPRWPGWVVGASALILILQCGVAALVVARKVPDWQATGHLPLLAGALPETMAGCTRISGPVELETTGMLAMGVKSQQWRYSREGLVAQVAMDDNFPGWHPLDDCYIFAGWIQESFETINGPGGPVMVSSYERDGGHHGYLAFGLRSRQGRWIGPPDVTARYSIALVNYLKYLYLGQDVSGTESPTRQLQVFIDSSRPLDSASKALALELFEEARGRLDPLLWPEAIP